MTPELEGDELKAGGKLVSGRLVVAGFLGLCLLTLAGVVLYRHAARARLAAELAEPRGRARAFSGLLRMNGLWGLVEEYAQDQRAGTPGEPYLVAREADGTTWHVVRASSLAAAGAPPATFIFSEDGKLVHVALGSPAYLLHGDEKGGTVAIVEPGGQAQDASAVELAGRKPRPCLSIRGAFALETTRGIVSFPGGRVPAAGRAPEASEGGEPALFRYDVEAACFRGPAGGNGTSWQVDREHSPGYCP